MGMAGCTCTPMPCRALLLKRRQYHYRYQTPTDTGVLTMSCKHARCVADIGFVDFLLDTASSGCLITSEMRELLGMSPVRSAMGGLGDAGCWGCRV